jgi:predicted AAA+ superfamily ATPase
MKKEAWYNHLGFYNNPFSIKPSAFNDELEGDNDNVVEINIKIMKSEFVLIYGPYGSGKTSILKKIINEFKGRKQLIYYNCNQSEAPINYDKLLIKSGGFLRRLFRIRKKNMILLLDEASLLNKRDLNLIKKYHQDKFFKSVVFVSKLEDIRFLKEITSLVGKNTFRINELKKEEAISLIRKRIGYLDFLTDSIIEYIFSKDKNPRMFLKNCEDVARYAFEQKAEQATKAHVQKVLG